MLFQCRPTVFDAGPTLKQHRLNASCFLEASCAQVPAVTLYITLIGRITLASATFFRRVDHRLAGVFFSAHLLWFMPSVRCDGLHRTKWTSGSFAEGEIPESPINHGLVLCGAKANSSNCSLEKWAVTVVCLCGAVRCRTKTNSSSSSVKKYEVTAVGLLHCGHICCVIIITTYVRANANST